MTILLARKLVFAIKMIM